MIASPPIKMLRQMKGEATTTARKARRHDPIRPHKVETRTRTPLGLPSLLAVQCRILIRFRTKQGFRPASVCDHVRWRSW